jgi:CheY-like chemotaxis protein
MARPVGPAGRPAPRLAGRHKGLRVVNAGVEPGTVWNRVIVVGDRDKATRELVAVALSTELSTQVLLAADARRLYDLVEHARPAVVVLDPRLAGPDGLEALHQLRADPSTAHVPLIAISTADDRRAALDAGCWAFVERPPDRDELVRLIAELMGAAGGVAGDRASVESAPR